VPEPVAGANTFAHLLQTETGQYTFDKALGKLVNCKHPSYWAANPNDPKKPFILPGAPVICTQGTTAIAAAQRLVRFSLSDPMKQLIAAVPQTTQPMLRLIFIEHFMVKDPDPTKPAVKNERTTGLAITDAGYVESYAIEDTLLTPLPPASTGVMFIAAGTLKGKLTFNAKTLAHEIGHIVIGMNQTTDGHMDTEKRNLMYGGPQDHNNVLKKRFDASQEKLIQGNTKYVKP
jgi:hypothetical protein